MPSTNRRRFLAVATALSVAGCTTQGEDTPRTTTGASRTDDRDSVTRTDVRSHGPTTSTATSRTTAHGTTTWPDVDERVDATPPADRPLPTDGGDWPQEGYDAARTGYWPDGDPVRDAVTYWTLDAGGEGAVVDDGVVNVHGRADGQPLTVRDPADASVRRSMSLVDYGVNAPPAVGDGLVFVTTFIEVFAFDLQTGDRAWRGPEMDGIHGAPTYANGTVFVASGGYQGVQAQVRAFAADTGEERWRVELDAWRTGSVAVRDGIAYLQTDSGFHAIDAETGGVVFEDSSLSNGHWVDPVVGEDHVYTVDDGELVAVDAAAGEERWRRGGDVRGTPVLADGEVYAGGDDQVVAYAAADGSRQRELPGGMPLARVGDVCYVAGDPTGWLRGVRASGGDDAERWTVRTPEVQVADAIYRGIYGVTPLDGALWVSAADGVHGLGPVE
jgi:hypothetical protein